MAFGAVVPFAFVFATKNGKIDLVVLGEVGGGPSGLGIVTQGAVHRKAAGLVVGGGGRAEIVFVAGETVGGGVGKIAVGMAGVAVGNIVAVGQGEEAVIGIAGYPFPGGAGHIVTNHTVFRIAGGFVVGAGSGGEVLKVAINAVVADAVKTEFGFRGMALVAGCCDVVAEQGKAVVLMELGNVVHQPVFGRVAAGAVVAYGHLVEVGMAGNTFGAGFGKNQRPVTIAAVNDGMLAGEGETGFCMTKKRALFRTFGNDQLAGIPTSSRYIPAFG